MIGQNLQVQCIDHYSHHMTKMWIFFCMEKKFDHSPEWKQQLLDIADNRNMNRVKRVDTDVKSSSKIHCNSVETANKYSEGEHNPHVLAV